MEFRTLRAFVEVVRQGGFSKAAKTVFATQSTVSKAVRQLEDELGMPLLNRIGHQSQLTTAGEVVYRRGLEMLANRDNLLAELDEIRGLKRGVLRLGLPPVGSNTLFAPLFAIYRRRYPDIEIRLIERGAAELKSNLLAGDVDCIGVLTPLPAAFDFCPVRREPLVAVLEAHHPLAERSTIALSDLKHTPFILFDSTFLLHRTVLDACRRAGFEPSVVAESSQIDFIVELVDAEIGVAFLPRMSASQRKRPSLRLVPLDDPGMVWEMVMAWRRGAYLSEAVKAWLDIVNEAHDGLSDRD